MNSFLARNNSFARSLAILYTCPCSSFGSTFSSSRISSNEITGKSLNLFLINVSLPVPGYPHNNITSP